MAWGRDSWGWSFCVGRVSVLSLESLWWTQESLSCPDWLKRSENRPRVETQQIKASASNSSGIEIVELVPVFCCCFFVIQDHTNVTIYVNHKHSIRIWDMIYYWYKSTPPKTNNVCAVFHLRFIRRSYEPYLVSFLWKRHVNAPPRSNNKAAGRTRNISWSVITFPIETKSY